MKKLLIITLIFFHFSTAGAVTVTGVSSSLTHGNAVTISGSDFGTKSPAAPLIWDNGESATVDTPSQVAARGWEDVRPIDGEPDDNTYAMQYRTTWQSMAQPHGRSTKYLAGGYYSSCQSGTQPCNNVQISISSTAGSQNHVFATWYLRADPLWENISYGTNYKEWFLREADASAWNDLDGVYFAAAGPPTPQTGNATIHLQQRTCGGVDPTAVDFEAVPNPTKGWVHREVIARRDDGYVSFKTGNTHSTGSPNSGSSAYCADGSLDSLGGMTIGGYARDAIDGSTDNRMRLWFDDIYIDTTWARVMLCNNATYSSATICEPQIPTAWAAEGNSITVTVNQGALSIGINYLFVFDSDNSANATGYAVTFSNSAVGITSSGVLFH